MSIDNATPEEHDEVNYKAYEEECPAWHDEVGYKLSDRLIAQELEDAFRDYQDRVNEILLRR